jgi:hypothetical protein
MLTPAAQSFNFWGQTPNSGQNCDPCCLARSGIRCLSQNSKIGETVNNNKLLIGALALGCGAAIFLLATDSGERLRVQIENRALDLYDEISEAVIDRWNRLRDIGQDVMSRESNQQVAEDLRHVA